MLPLLSWFSSPWFVCRFVMMSNNRVKTVARFPARCARTSPWWRQVMLTRRSARRWRGRSAPPSRGRSAARWWTRSLTSQPKRWAELSLDFSYTITFTLLCIGLQHSLFGRLYTVYTISQEYSQEGFKEAVSHQVCHEVWAQECTLFWYVSISIT